MQQIAAVETGEDAQDFITQLPQALQAVYLQSFNCAAFAPNSAATLFAGTDQGVYYSSNGGVTWRLSVAGTGVAWPLSVSTIAVSPNFAIDRTVFAFAFDYANYVGHVLRSTDGGVTFTNPAGNYLTNPYSTRERLAVSPNFAADNRVFMTAGLYSGYSNFYVSYNGGDTFIAVGPPFNGAEDVREAARFAISPSYASDRTIYLNNRISTPWTLRSNDVNNILFFRPPAAEPWPVYSWLAPVLSPDYDHNAAPSGSNKTLFVGCEKTTDDGVSFSPVPVCGNVYLAPTYPTTDLLYVTDNGNNYWDSGSGLFRHSTASPAYTALTPPAGGSFGSIGQVAFSPTFASDSTLLVAGGGGLYLSTDAGDNFTVMTGGDSFSTQITAVAPDPSSPNRLFIGSTSAGVAMSLDDGASALSITGNLPSQPVQALLATGSPTALLAALPSGTFRRIDFTPGGSWSLQAPGDIRRLEPDLAGGRIYAARTDGASLVSLDDGLTWNPLSTSALPDAVDIVRVPGGSAPPEAANAPSGSTAALWAASLSGGARWSNNSGVTWNPAPGSGDYTLPAGGNWSTVRALGINLQTGGREVMIGNSVQGLFHSRDGGDNWHRVSGPGTGLEATSQNVSALLTTPTAFGTTDILVGVNGATNGGVYLSGDGGDHWTQINQGFDPNNLNITTLVRTSCSGCPVQYYSGTYGSGVYTRTITVNLPPAITGWCFNGTGCACGTAAAGGPEQGGQGFKLCGANFLALPAVEFDGVPAMGCTATSAATLTCSGTPGHFPGSAVIRVRNSDTRTGVMAAAYTYLSGTPRVVNLRLAKTGGDADLTWSCPGCTPAAPARVYRSQNGAFTLNLEIYNGGTSGSWTHTGALAASAFSSYFWTVD